MTPLRIFISSVQGEFAEERAILRDYVRSDRLIRRFFEVFLFEDAPASDRRPDQLYLDEVERCDISSDIGCAHFHGTEVAKPIPTYQVYKGTAFDLVDQAVDFVLSKINRSIGTRAESVRAPRTYEIPPEVVTVAIVNAVVHRDYTDNGSVQVMLFADRLEVRNPGRLPPPLTLEKLREAHRSVTRQPPGWGGPVSDRVHRTHGNGDAGHDPPLCRGGAG